jgi:hypothetical protein
MSDDREQMRELGALEEELESERDELARLHQQLDEHVVRISNLERRLGQLTPAEGDEPRPVPLKTLPRTRAAPAGTGDFGAISEELSYALARCGASRSTRRPGWWGWSRDFASSRGSTDRICSRCAVVVSGASSF